MSFDETRGKWQCRLILVQESAVDGSIDGCLASGQVHAEMFLQLSTDPTFRYRVEVSRAKCVIDSAVNVNVRRSVAVMTSVWSATSWNVDVQVVCGWA